MDESRATCVYRLDREFRITYLNPNWGLFASDNEAAALDPEKVIGTSLWEHLADAETKELYRAILNRVSKVNTQFRFPFRCDSPKARRFMELSVIHLSDGSYEFTSKLLRVEDRSFQRLLAAETPRSDEFIVSCAWCKKFALPDKRWVEVEEAVKELKVFVAPALPRISHGVCPECRSNILGGLEALEGAGVPE